MIPIVFGLFCLFIFGIYNIYFVIYRQKKYKTLLILVFYIIAMINLICAIGQSAFIFNSDYCSTINVVPSYMHSFTNLALGLCQTAIILEIAIALKRLMTRSLQTTSQEKSKTIRCLGITSVTFKCCFIALMLFDVGIAIYIVVKFESKVAEDCKLTEWKRLHAYYHFYNEYRIFMGSFIVMLLSLSTCITSRMLRKHFGRFFDTKMKEMILVNIVFITSYTIWSVYAIFEYIYDYDYLD